MIKYALPSLIHVGHSYKAIGIGGHVIIELFEAYEALAEELQYLFVSRDGQSLPIFIENISNDDPLTIKFEGYDDPESSQMISNQAIYLDPDFLSKYDIDTTKSIEGLEGFTLYNREKVIGTISDVIEFPGQMMISVLGLNGILIPAVEQWILDINVNTKEIFMDFDDESLNLND